MTPFQVTNILCSLPCSVRVCWRNVFHCCGKQGWKRSVLGRMRAVNWPFSLGEGCYGKRAIVMKAVVGKHCFVTVTLSCRFKRCWCKPSQILPCQQAVVRAKEHSRFLACTETQQAEENRGHDFHCSLLLHMAFVHVAFLGALRLLSGDPSLTGVTEAKPDLASLWF